jgi:hypothetical protein
MREPRGVARPSICIALAARASLLFCTLLYPFAAAAADQSVENNETESAFGQSDNRGQFEPGWNLGPVVYELSTIAPYGSGAISVDLVMSSKVHAVGATGTIRYAYTYAFENKGHTGLKLTLVGTRLALSSLFELMQDFSLVLSPGEIKTFQFITTSEPELLPATAYNAAHDHERNRWNFVNSGAVSLYLPASLRPDYTFG